MTRNDLTTFSLTTILLLARENRRYLATRWQNPTGYKAQLCLKAHNDLMDHYHQRIEAGETPASIKPTDCLKAALQAEFAQAL